MIEYRIKTNKDFTEKIGELVCMLEHSREVTLSEISNLNQNDLDYLPNNRSNSIGSLLSHIASIEFVHQCISFENRDFTNEEYFEWGAALELGDKGREVIRSHSIDYLNYHKLETIH